MFDLLLAWIIKRRNKLIYSFTIVTVVNVVYSIYVPDVHTALLYYIFPSLITAGLLSNRKKYEYEAHSFSLPIKHTTIAGTRFIFTLLAIFTQQLFNLTLNIFLPEESLPGVINLVCGTSFAVLYCSVFFISRDISLSWLRRQGIKPEHIKHFYIFLVIIGNVFLLILFKYRDVFDPQIVFNSIGDFFSYIKSKSFIWVYFMPSISVIMGLLSIQSIKFRKYFLDV